MISELMHVIDSSKFPKDIDEYLQENICRSNNSGTKWYITEIDDFNCFNEVDSVNSFLITSGFPIGSYVIIYFSW